MPGYGFDDDELKKLFAEAGDAVKKASTRPAPVESATPPQAPPPPPPLAAAPPAPPHAAPEPLPPPVAEAPPVERATSIPPAAPGEPRKIVGGEQGAEGLTVRTADGQAIALPWHAIRGLTLGRVGDRQWLAFGSGGSLYYFGDDNVAYKGLLKSMQASTAMNWRGLVQELASQVPDSGDAGVTVLTGGSGGSIPKYQDRQTFWATVQSRLA